MLKQLKKQNFHTSKMSCFTPSTSKKKQNKQNFLLPGLIITKLKINDRPEISKTQSKGLAGLRVIQNLRQQNQGVNCQEVQCTIKTGNSHRNSLSIKRQLMYLQENEGNFMRKNLLLTIKKQKQHLQANPIKINSSQNKKNKKQKFKSDCKLILQRNCQFPFMSRNLIKPNLSKNQDKIFLQQDQSIFYLSDTQASSIEYNFDHQSFVSIDSMKEILNL